MRTQLPSESERPVDSATPGAHVQRLVASFARCNLASRLAAVRAQIDGRVVFTTSFGLEDQVITHAIFTQNLAIDVVTLDTGRLFSQTYDLWTETEHRYGRLIRSLSPNHVQLEALIERQGINGFRTSVDARHACCGVRKVEPLGRALTGAAVWISGLRADQSFSRGETLAAAFDATHGLIKVNPLFDWSRDKVASYAREQDVPTNPLHDDGFLSIGCAPCTRAVKPGEPERAGRWWWEQNEKKECGLHQRSRGARPVPVAATLVSSRAGD